MPSKNDILNEKQKLIEELEFLNEEKRKEKARNNFIDFCEYVIKDEKTSSKIKLAELQKTWIRHISFCKKHNLNCLILAPMSSGKCVDLDTEFITKDNGIALASELSVGDTVLAYDDIEEQYCWREVVAKELQDPKDAIRVTTKQGRSITTTYDHKFLTIDGWVEAQDLIPNKTHLLGPCDWSTEASSTNSLTSDTMYALGVSFGRLNCGASFYGKENVDLVGISYENLTGRSFHRSRYSDSIKYRNQICYRILNEVTKDLDKFLDRLVLEDKNLVRYFLSGVFDVVGKVDRRKKLYYYNATLSRCKKLQTICAYVGVETSVVNRIYVDTTDTEMCSKLLVSSDSTAVFSKFPVRHRVVHVKKKSSSIDTTIDTVLRVESLGPRQTVGIEVKDVHTHVTNGLCTHNTQIIAVALPLYFLGKDTTKRIKMVCLSDKAAKERLGAVRSYIVDDDDYKSLFPHVKPDKKQEWTRHTIFVERDTIAKDASIDTYGVVSSGIGGRCDLLLVDDIFDQRTAVSQPSSRQQIISTFNQVWLSRVEPNGQVVIICTRWHEQDLAGDILSDEGKLRRYGVLIQRVSDDMDHINCEVLVPDDIADEYMGMDRGYKGYSSF